MWIYIAGKITSDKNYRSKFLRAEIRLREAGFSDVVNPVRYVRIGESWNMAMRQVLPYLMRCDAVALLPGWEESRGAKIEVGLARELEMEVLDIEEWIWLMKEQKFEGVPVSDEKKRMWIVHKASLK
jgi:hypothetical protein